MSRWHKLSCTDPDIVVDGDTGTPRCRACSSSPSIQELINKQASTAAPWVHMADEPPDQIRLWWPSSDLYSRSHSHSRELQSTAEMPMPVTVPGIQDPPAPSPAESDQSVSTTNTSAVTTSEPFLPSPVYAKQLGPDEFRLLCLDAVADGADDDYPIHVTIEAFRRDECPEYETVSYTWAGEDEDMRFRHPVYVGACWDILLQTKNCCSLLRHLRPWKGIRTIWIDAICINQKDTSEREMQVANMGSVYRQCRRVVVYLGNDIVETNSKRHRPRYDLQDLEVVIRDPALSLQTLISRSYFKRVWVIQELILSPLIVIPIRGIDFFAGGLKSSDLETIFGPKHLKINDAPWLEHITRGSLPENTLDQLLRQIWKSKASDRRDKVFGLLGLMDRVTGKDLLKANYSISYQHTCMGIFTYILLELKRTIVFTAASCLRAEGPCPSWMPDWRLSEILKYERILDLDNVYPGVQYGRWPIRIYSFDLKTPEDEMTYYRFKDGREVHWDDVWHQSASVDSSTASLSINLIHLLQFRSRPKLRGESDKFHRFEIESGESSISLRTAKVPLDKMVTPEPTHLFILKDRNAHGCILLFLREVPGSNSYKLVFCCMCYGIDLNMEGSLHSHKNLWQGWDDNILFHLHENLFSILTRISDALGEDLDREAKLVYSYRTFKRYWTSQSLAQVLPGHPRTIRELLELQQGIINDERGLTPGFVQYYTKNLQEKSAEYFPKVENEFVYFQLDPNLRQRPNAVAGYWREADSTNNMDVSFEPSISWEWRCSEFFSNNWTSSEMTKQTNQVVEVRARLEEVRETVVHYWRYGKRAKEGHPSLFWLSHYTHLTSENELDMVTRGPQLEDKFLYSHPWPESVADLGLDGTVRRVTIV